MADQETIDGTASARSSAQEPEPARFDITIRQASLLFADLGVPRSPRSVQGFCKDGHIDSILVKGPTGDRYFVSRESIARYATELKQIEEVAKLGAESDSAQDRQPARESAPMRATSDPVQVTATTDSKNQEGELIETVKQLRDENLNLRVDNRGKENFINQLVQDRNRLIDAVQEVSYKLGAAESRVQQLEAPKDEARRSAQDREPARDVGFEESGNPSLVVIGHDDQEGNTVANVVPKPDEASIMVVTPPRRSVWNKIFG